GKAFAERFAQIFVSGISAGDAKVLSFQALFPRLREIEETKGSLLKGMIAQAKLSKAAKDPRLGRLQSFKGGMATLSSRLAEVLDQDLAVYEAVQSIEADADGYMLYTPKQTYHAKKLALTTPAFVSAGLLKDILPQTALLHDIPYVDVQVFGLAYHRIDVPHALDGFGFLVPPEEGLSLLGVLFSSSTFPSQSPPHTALLRIITGGSLNPDFAKQSPDEALKQVKTDLKKTLGIHAEPLWQKAIFIDKAIPQYQLGHRQLISQVLHEGAKKQLYLGGNAFLGVAVNDCIRDAKRLSRALGAKIAS
ncbi:MAG: protoporphyrinogen oxidase, partial [Deinococcales bacterium]